MSVSIHPALILVLGSLLLLFCKGKVRGALFVLLPVLGFINLLGIANGTATHLYFAGLELEVMRADRLSLLFGYLFHIAAFLGAVYGFGLKSGVQQVSALMYAGAGVGVVFAGDLLTLFIFWELMAVSSVFQIWVRRRPGSVACGLRYLLMHVTSGLLLITGAAVQFQRTGSLSFELMELRGAAAWLLFLAFGIKCAFPLLHTWLVESYPESTPTGTVFLSAYSTKAAVYALARGYAGTEELIVIGTVMTMFPIFYAVIENDLRKVLGYSMINQLGFMVVGIGIGTPLALNGAVAHAFNDVIFKGLLFMSMGAVLFRTGKINGTDLGGLYKSMPLTAGFCVVGAASISAFPLFSGFVSKSMVMAAAGEEGHVVVWLFLLFASAGVFHHAGIKIPYFAFFAHDSGIRTKEAPFNMLLGMGLASAICIFNGSFPGFLFDFLPYKVDYHPYTLTHVISQTQLLFFSALAFTCLMLTRIYPSEMVAINLDFEWFYRKAMRLVLKFSDKSLNGLNAWAYRLCVGKILPRLARFSDHAPARILAAAIVPYWRFQGLDRDAIEEKKNDLFRQARLGAFPIGLTACFAILGLAILFTF